MKLDKTIFCYDGKIKDKNTMVLPYLAGCAAINGACVPVYKDLAEDIHLLISGATGTGKSNTLHHIIGSLKCPILLCDPKYSEFHIWKNYKKVIHSKIYNDMDDIQIALEWVYKFTLDRFKSLQAAGCNDIKAYNVTASKPLQHICIVVDECHIISGKSKKYLEKIATIGRAAGVHLILATQKPSSSAFPTIIREQANGRISHFLASATASKMALGEEGAEQLPKRPGTLLYKHIGQDGLTALQMPRFDYNRI